MLSFRLNTEAEANPNPNPSPNASWSSEPGVWPESDAPGFDRPPFFESRYRTLTLILILTLALTVWRSGKASDWLHRGKSCLGSNPALGLVSQNTRSNLNRT